VDEVKGFLKTELVFVYQMYSSAFLEEDDLRFALKEDLVKLIINVIINEDLYKVLVLLYRIDNFELDKDLRMKYSTLKGVKTTDFAIDPYLSLAQPLVVIKEASKKYGIDIKASSELV
jgi:hypothetical protein